MPRRSKNYGPIILLAVGLIIISLVFAPNILQGAISRIDPRRTVTTDAAVLIGYAVTDSGTRIQLNQPRLSFEPGAVAYLAITYFVKFNPQGTMRLGSYTEINTCNPTCRRISSATAAGLQANRFEPSDELLSLLRTGREIEVMQIGAGTLDLGVNNVVGTFKGWIEDDRGWHIAALSFTARIEVGGDKTSMFISSFESIPEPFRSTSDPRRDISFLIVKVDECAEVNGKIISIVKGATCTRV